MRLIVFSSFYFAIVLCTLAVSSTSCTLRKQNNGSSDQPAREGEPSQNRPDTTGIPPKTQYVLGATFYHERLVESDEREIKIPQFAEQSCLFQRTASRSIFRWDFSDSLSRSAKRQLAIDLNTARMPVADQILTIQGRSEVGSLSLRLPGMGKDIFDRWVVDPFANDSFCEIKIMRVLKADGSLAESGFTGPFRLESFAKCNLVPFGSQHKQMLKFDTELACTGNAPTSTPGMSPNFRKWFMSFESRLVFELEDQPMAEVIAKSYCADKLVKARLPSRDEVLASRLEILKELFPDKNEVPPVWISEAGATLVLADLASATPKASQPTDSTTAFTICVH